MFSLLKNGVEESSKRKKDHEHGQQCDDSRGEGGIRGLSGNGKNTIKNFKNVSTMK